MSERMIELQRARLLGVPLNGTSAANQPPQSARPSNAGGAVGGAAHAASAAARAPQTPQQAAAATLRSEEERLQIFLHKLQSGRDDGHPSSDGIGPTVPTALSRRMLQQRGVGYIDSTVAALTSASADRFLATVLQQAIACRDQRRQGAEMAREAARHRQRHMQNYQNAADDRKRRREQSDATRESSYLAAIQAGDALKRGSGSNANSASADGDDKKAASKKKKKKPAAAVIDASAGINVNGIAGDGKDGADEVAIDDQEDDEYDSLDEEEEYYQERLGGPDAISLRRRKDVEDDTLLLRDISRPLEAWDFHITGKEDLEFEESDSEDEDMDEMNTEVDNRPVSQGDDNGNEDDLFSLDGLDAKQGDDADAPSTAKRKTAPSPTPAS